MSFNRCKIKIKKKQKRDNEKIIGQRDARSLETLRRRTEKWTASVMESYKTRAIRWRRQPLAPACAADNSSPTIYVSSPARKLSAASSAWEMRERIELNGEISSFSVAYGPSRGRTRSFHRMRAQVRTLLKQADFKHGGGATRTGATRVDQYHLA